MPRKLCWTAPWWVYLNDNTKYEWKTGQLGHYAVNGEITDQNVVKVKDLSDGVVDGKTCFHVLLLNKNGEAIG